MTGLFGGPRVPKNSPRICAYGSIDELNATLGLARAHSLPPELDSFLVAIQSELFSIGAELATPDPEKHGLKWESGDSVASMEGWIDSLESELPPLRNFILPGGTLQGAQLHVARTVCRRAEREIVGLSIDRELSDIGHIVIYLNRLSDLLFVMARYANSIAKAEEIAWRKSP